MSPLPERTNTWAQSWNPLTGSHHDVITAGADARAGHCVFPAGYRRRCLVYWTLLSSIDHVTIRGRRETCIDCPVVAR